MRVWGASVSCYENLLSKQMRSMHEANVAFVLSPAAAGRPISPVPTENSKTKLNARSVFVLSLGVPVIIANTAGTVDTALPENIRQLRIGFPGASSIVDGDGIIKAEGGRGEGIIVGAIRLKGAPGQNDLA
jgi:predicted amidohydrolase